MEKQNTDFYNRKYSEGDFNYDPMVERSWLEKHIVNRFGLSLGDRVLDLGCGKGLHAALLSSFGLRVFGIEPSFQGVMGAIERGSKAIFIRDSASALEHYFDENEFDLIFCRGMSWYHRELDQLCPDTGIDVREATGDFFKYIKPGGLLVLQICTDFSGYNPNKDAYNNRLSSYLDLFQLHGEIVHVTNWAGTPLTSDEQAAKVKGGIVIATRKVNCSHPGQQFH
ncbi:hypothetical protein Enr10x_58620 [Gimesia panareensis]|uniref:Methyltransferase type 11 domain-containing protein n=1 Tax=Gimesia panareensis TaxID=2527978 RepID=A0A517QFS3_9PLAN|nr:class I SAM-dependent methyltransferase [Gimesia panareensis]QDT30496.1 hypothetical protein Enr10x_58620 [Gimesia panareensis]